jgi:protease I
MALVSNMKIAVLARHGVIQEQLALIREQLEQSGLSVIIASQRLGEVVSSGKNGTRIKVDIPVHDLTAADLDGLIIPAQLLPAELGSDPDVIELISELIVTGKLVGAIGSGVLVLAGTKAIHGRLVGVSDEDRESLASTGVRPNGPCLTVDGALITCPDDSLSAFTTAFYDAISSRIRRKPPVQI